MSYDYLLTTQKRLPMKLFKILFSTVTLIVLLSFQVMAQSNPTPIGDVLSDSMDDDIVTIQGRVTLFKDDDEMFVVDPTGKILVELKEEHEKIGLKKGSEVEITGEVEVGYFSNNKKFEAIDITILK